MAYLESLKAEWRRWDCEELKQNEEHLAYFEELYLKYLSDDEIRESIVSSINQLKEEIGILNEKLIRKDTAFRKIIQWHME
jgi:hypothetical protein